MIGGHRRNAQLFCERAHGERLQPARTSEAQPRLNNLLKGEAISPVRANGLAPRLSLLAGPCRRWHDYADYEGSFGDDEGYLFLSGRKGDMIIRGGENVYPIEVEPVLLTHPTVADAASRASRRATF